jgi:hypothetical protein
MLEKADEIGIESASQSSPRSSSPSASYLGSAGTSLGLYCHDTLGGGTQENSEPSLQPVMRRIHRTHGLSHVENFALEESACVRDAGR